MVSLLLDIFIFMCYAIVIVGDWFGVVEERPDCGWYCAGDVKEDGKWVVAVSTVRELEGGELPEASLPPASEWEALKGSSVEWSTLERQARPVREMVRTSSPTIMAAAKDSETPQQLATRLKLKLFDIIFLNTHLYPGLTSSSKLKAGTQLRPQSDGLQQTAFCKILEGHFKSGPSDPYASGALL